MVLRRTLTRLTWLEHAKQQRAAQATQFATMDGWERGADHRFDDYVAEKRRAASYDEFDQRVERAYLQAVKMHKVEIWNGVKRGLKRSGDKLSTDGMRDANKLIEQRTTWLRDVFAQIDTDYRSGDPTREAAAADEIGKALNGEPSDYLTWAYDRKIARRGLGAKGKAAADAESRDANVPEITEDEANRYANLKLNMGHIEEAVTAKFGRAGEEHWDVLQREKDGEYMAKLQRASDTYQELLDQQTAYDESGSNTRFKLDIERMHRSQVRFQAALEIEDERYKMVEAHREMQRNKFEEAKQRQRVRLQEAAQMRAEGKTPQEVQEILHAQSMQRVIDQHSERSAQEQTQVLQRKRAFLDLIDQVEDDIEAREGAELMGQGQPGASGLESSSQGSAPSLWSDAGALAAERGDTTPAAQKRALWDVINEDKSEDPALKVHQMRMHAKETYSDVYSMMRPEKLRLGRKAFRTDSSMIAGGGTERQILQDGKKEELSFTWGMNHLDMFHFCGDGNKDWVIDVTGTHVLDKKTGDIDWTQEKKLSRGPVFRGPRYYKLGVDNDDARKDDAMK